MAKENGRQRGKNTATARTDRVGSSWGERKQGGLEQPMTVSNVETRNLNFR